MARPLDFHLRADSGLVELAEGIRARMDRPGRFVLVIRADGGVRIYDPGKPIAAADHGHVMGTYTRRVKVDELVEDLAWRVKLAAHTTPPAVLA